MSRLAAATGTAILAAAAAAGPVDIKYKWEKGEPVVYRMTNQISGTMTMPGRDPMEMSQKHSSTTKMEVQEVAADGAATVRTTTESVRVEMTMPPMGEMVYDSADPGGNTGGNPMMEAYSVMVGTGFTMTITPQGEVRRLEGMDDVVDRIAAKMGQPAMAESLKEGLGDEAIRSMMEQCFKMWPAEGVEPGDTWTGAVSQKLPMMGTMKIDATMTLKEVTEISGRRMARIANTMTMTLQPPGKDELGDMPDVKISMTGGAGEGETLFDLDRGQLQRTALTMRMPMEMSMPGHDGRTMTMKQDMKGVTIMERIEDANAGAAEKK